MIFGQMRIDSRIHDFIRHKKIAALWHVFSTIGYRFVKRLDGFRLRPAVALLKYGAIDSYFKYIVRSVTDRCGGRYHETERY